MAAPTLSFVPGMIVPGEYLSAAAREWRRFADRARTEFVERTAARGLPLQELYVRALEGRDCAMRRVAAKRLVEFRSTDAMPPLEKLKALPKKKGEEDCGQAAAEAALKQLARE